MFPRQLRRLAIRVCIVGFVFWGATFFLGLWKDDASSSGNGNVQEMAIDDVNVGMRVEDNLKNIGRVGHDNFVAEPVTEPRDSAIAHAGFVTERNIEQKKEIDKLRNHDKTKKTTEKTEQKEVKKEDVAQLGAPVKRRDNENVALDAPGKSLL